MIWRLIWLYSDELLWRIRYACSIETRNARTHKHPDWIGPKNMFCYFRIQYTSTHWFVQTAFVTINSISTSNLRKMLVVVSFDAIISLMVFAFMKWWHTCDFEKNKNKMLTVRKWRRRCREGKSEIRSYLQYAFSHFEHLFFVLCVRARVCVCISAVAFIRLNTKLEFAHTSMKLDGISIFILIESWWNTIEDCVW